MAQELARSTDAMVSEYAMGCLHNATEIIAATVAQRQAVMHERREAAAKIQAAARAMLTRRREGGLPGGLTHGLAEVVQEAVAAESAAASAEVATEEDGGSQEAAVAAEGEADAEAEAAAEGEAAEAAAEAEAAAAEAEAAAAEAEMAAAEAEYAADVEAAAEAEADPETAAAATGDDEDAHDAEAAAGAAAEAAGVAAEGASSEAEIGAELVDGGAGVLPGSGLGSSAALPSIPEATADDGEGDGGRGAGDDDLEEEMDEEERALAAALAAKAEKKKQLLAAREARKRAAQEALARAEAEEAELIRELGGDADLAAAGADGATPSVAAASAEAGAAPTTEADGSAGLPEVEGDDRSPEEIAAAVKIGAVARGRSERQRLHLKQQLDSAPVPGEGAADVAPADGEAPAPLAEDGTAPPAGGAAAREESAEADAAITPADGETGEQEAEAAEAGATTADAPPAALPSESEEPVADVVAAQGADGAAADADGAAAPADAAADSAATEPATGGVPEDASAAADVPAADAVAPPAEVPPPVAPPEAQAEELPPPPPPPPLKPLEREEVVATLKEMLKASSTRVVDLFHKWDADSSGEVDLHEFRQAMAALGLANADSGWDAADAVFAQLDIDGLGSIEYEEINSILKASAEELAASAARREKEQRRAKAAAFTTLEASEEAGSVAEQILGILAVNAARASDLFKLWDLDKNGLVSKDEFRRAVEAMGYKAAAEDVDAAFDTIDDDRTGTIKYQEIRKVVGTKMKGVSAKQAAAAKRADKKRAREEAREARKAEEARKAKEEAAAAAAAVLAEACERCAVSATIEPYVVDDSHEVCVRVSFSVRDAAAAAEAADGKARPPARDQVRVRVELLDAAPGEAWQACSHLRVHAIAVETEAELARKADEEAEWARALAGAAVPLQVVVNRALRVDPSTRPAMLVILQDKRLGGTEKKKKIEAVLKRAEAAAKAQDDTAAAAIQARIRGRNARAGKKAGPPAGGQRASRLSGEKPQSEARAADGRGAAPGAAGGYDLVVDGQRLDPREVVGELTAARSKMGTLQASVERQCDELVKLRRDLHSAQLGRRELRDELKRHLEDTAKKLKEANSDPWERQVVALKGSAAEILRIEQEKLQDTLNQRLGEQSSSEAHRERQELMMAAAKARREMEEADAQARHARELWKKKRQQHVIKAAEALQEARVRKERAMKSAAEAMRLRFVQIQRAEDTFHASRSAISLGRGGPKPFLPHKQSLPPLTPETLARSQSLQTLPREARGGMPQTPLAYPAGSLSAPRTKRSYRTPSAPSIVGASPKIAAAVEPRLYAPLPGTVRLSELDRRRAPAGAALLPPLPRPPLLDFKDATDEAGAADGAAAGAAQSDDAAATRIQAHLRGRHSRGGGGGGGAPASPLRAVARVTLADDIMKGGVGLTLDVIDVM